jgi:phosphomannomutase
LGSINKNHDFANVHYNKILALPEVDVEAIKKANFTIVVDAVNSTGGTFIPELLQLLGVKTVHKLYCEPNGHFPHNPEPLPEHLTDLSQAVVKERADLGIVVDPDVDRLAFMDENGEMFGEEYTLVACADYVLSKTPGNTVSNMSSTRALRDVTEKHGGTYEASAVGEVNVVELMKKNKAIIGGEGNGGIIYPELHYGRDALVGVALFLSMLAEKQMSVSALRASYPNYFMSKKKIELTPTLDVDAILKAMEARYQNERLTTIDGVKIDFSQSWVHLRKSNTEPIIRIYTEAPSQEEADALADKIISEIKAIANI